MSMVRLMSEFCGFFPPPAFNYMVTFLAARTTVQPLGDLPSLPGEIENFAPGICWCLFRLYTGWSLLCFVCSLWGLLESSFSLWPRV